MAKEKQAIFEQELLHTLKKGNEPVGYNIPKSLYARITDTAYEA